MIVPVDPSHRTDRSDLEALGAAVRARRRRLGLTQQEVADLAGISERSVRAIEHGKATLQIDVLLRAFAGVGLALRLEPGNGEIVVPDGG